LNLKERFLSTFQYKDVDRVPDFEFGYWTDTIDRWHKEGLPLEKRNIKDIELYFKLEGWDCGKWLPVRTQFWPSLPSRIIKEKEDRAIVEDGMGGIFLQNLDSSSPPHYLRHPLKNREDWEKLKPFFNPDTPGRFPLNWDEISESYKDRDYPLGISIGSLYGWLRNLMGVEALSIAFYRDPDWIAEMMDTLTDLWIKIIRRALRLVKVDFSSWWEDMCYNKGSLLSVRHFEEFMVPRYKKVTSILKEYGVKTNVLDCDGNITSLIPGWLKGGINCMFPLEARWTDMYMLRKQFGKRVLLLGAVDKLALIKGKHGIDKEIKRIAPMLDDGGYIPMVDHRCPPEVSYKTYKYYLKKKRELIGREDVGLPE
jgi:uroporphyrinogen decarboxylase